MLSFGDHFQSATSISLLQNSPDASPIPAMSLFPPVPANMPDSETTFHNEYLLYHRLITADNNITLAEIGSIINVAEFQPVLAIIATWGIDITATIVPEMITFSMVSLVACFPAELRKSN